MELLLILAFIWLVGAMFPGSGGGFVDVAGAVAGLLAGIIVFGALFAYWGLCVAGIAWLAGERPGHGAMAAAIFGPIVVPMLIAGGVEWARNR